VIEDDITGDEEIKLWLAGLAHLALLLDSLRRIILASIDRHGDKPDWML
jgi:hypothetical protein